jgi:CRISPR-associated endonuclease/helicase Cas3
VNPGNGTEIQKSKLLNPYDQQNVFQRRDSKMAPSIASLFQTLTQFQPRNFQQQTITQILQSQSILLRAPTGSGKTETAIAPFLIAKQLGISTFPNKLLYIVPLRTLANSLRSRTQKMIERWQATHPTVRSLVVTLQTGESPEDPRFEGDIIFCTIDQLLSSFLSIPYSVGHGSANLNAGVVFASYLVFDELHLLDPERSFTTTLELLRQVAGISPFLLMTATLSHELAQQIQQAIAPHSPQLITIEGSDLQQIEGTRHRTFRPSSESLSAETILQDIQQNQRDRVIVLCNMVSQSQGLYQDLVELAQDEVEVLLLHSRFLPRDRISKEQALEIRFGRNWQPQEKCQVLIATQVIEAGIDLTCQILHTVLCPANSLLQRAGRCARFANEHGEVRVYRTVQLSDQESPSRPSFRPYSTKLCHLTWEILTAHNSAQPVGFEIEASWINAIHTEENQQQFQARLENQFQFTTELNRAIFEGDRSVAQSLIRAVDQRSVFMVEDEAIIDFDAPTVDIRQLQPFSLPRTTLCNLLRKFQEAGHKDWLFKRVEVTREQESYALPSAIPIQTVREINESISLILNPRYTSYDNEIGLRIGENGYYRSLPKPGKPNISKEYTYHMDTYTGHLVRMWDCWHQPFRTELQLNGEESVVQLASVRAEMLQAGRLFIQRKLFPTASKAQANALFELLACLAILTHDLGKLQQQWQTVMQGWQQQAYSLYQRLPEKPNFRVLNPQQNLLAHTDYQPNHEPLKQAYDRYMHQHKRPTHAVESAFLSIEILEAVLTPVLEQVFQATEADLFGIHHALQLTTGRHHSAWAKGWERVDRQNFLELHPKVNSAISQTWTILRRKLPDILPLPTELPTYPTRLRLEEFSLGQFTPEDLKYQQLYWLIARVLRLCDTRSVQI